MADTKKTKSFDSGMTGAPVLSGTAGALIAVLDAVLVTGFGLQTASSVVVTSGIATATYATAHSFRVDTVALVAGATPAGLNGEKRILSVLGANSVTFDATGITDGTATGAITSKVAPAGWTKAFTGTNVAVYKITSPEGTGFYLRVDDDGTTTARVRGYETMSDVNTGTGPFPTVTQFAAPGLWWSKSNAESVAARPWRIFADDRGIYYFPKQAGTGGEHQGNYFGDVLSLKSNDPYACVLRAGTQSWATTTNALSEGIGHADGGQSQDGLYAARAANTLGSSIKHYHCPVILAGLASTHFSGSVGFAYPSPVDNGLMLSPLLLYSAQGYRGYFPGIFYSPQITNASFSSGDTILGSGDLVGKRVTAIKMGTTAPGESQGVVFIDSVSDWR